MVVYIYCAVFCLLHRVEELAAYVIIIIRSGLAEMGDHSTTPRATVMFTMFGSITISFISDHGQFIRCYIDM
jgi:hypothetical protein